MEQSGGGALSYGQIEQLWINAGGSSALAPLMAAIALAESSGNPGAVNDQDNNGTQTSWGLWQISNGTHSWPGAQNPLDPAANADYAVQKLKDQGLSAWGTYTSGAYRQYLQGDVPPSALAGASGAASFTGAAGISSVAGFQIPGAGILKGTLSDIGKIAGSGLGPLSGILGSPFGTVKTAASGLENISKAMATIATVFSAFLWLTQPSSWLRLGAFAVGFWALLIGGYLLATTR